MYYEYICISIRWYAMCKRKRNLKAMKYLSLEISLRNYLPKHF